MTLFSWTGKGIYIPSLFIFLVSTITIFGKEPTNQSLSFSIALLITAIFSWLIGKQLNKSGTPKHTLLLLSMEKWGIILGIIGLIGLVISIL